MIGVFIELLAITRRHYCNSWRRIRCTTFDSVPVSHAIGSKKAANKETFLHSHLHKTSLDLQTILADKRLD